MRSGYQCIRPVAECYIGAQSSIEEGSQVQNGGYFPFVIQFSSLGSNFFTVTSYQGKLTPAIETVVLLAFSVWHVVFGISEVRKVSKLGCMAQYLLDLVVYSNDSCRC